MTHYEAHNQLHLAHDEYQEFPDPTSVGEGQYGEEYNDPQYYNGHEYQNYYYENEYGEGEEAFEVTYGDAFVPSTPGGIDQNYPDFSYMDTGFQPLGDDPHQTNGQNNHGYTNATNLHFQPYGETGAVALDVAYENPFDITDECEADLAAIEEAEKAMQEAEEFAARQMAKATQRAEEARIAAEQKAAREIQLQQQHHVQSTPPKPINPVQQSPISIRGGRGIPHRATSSMALPSTAAPANNLPTANPNVVPNGFRVHTQSHPLPAALVGHDGKPRAGSLLKHADTKKTATTPILHPPAKPVQKSVSANSATGLVRPPGFGAGLPPDYRRMTDQGPISPKGLSGSRPSSDTRERRHSPSFTSRGIDLSEVSDIPVPATVDPTVGLPPHKDPDSFRLKMLLESGKIILEVAPKRSTCQDIKKLLIANEKETGISEAISKKLAFKIPGAGWIANEHEPIGAIPYFQNAAKRRDDPHLMLVRKDGTYFKAVKLDDVCIGGLLRSPIAWQQHDDENTAFRQCMARIRLQERIYVEQEKIRTANHSLIPVALGDEPPKKKVIITLQVDASSKKKVQALPEDTADSFLERCFKYFAESKKGREWSTYALVAKGLAVYLAGPHRIFDIEYIQRCSLTNTEVVLCLIDRKAIEVEKKEGAYIFEAEENFLSTDPTIHYDHTQIVSGQGPPNVKSVWDLSEPFSVQIIALGGLPTQLAKGTTVYVRMTVLCGDDLVFKPQQTKDVPIDANGNALINCPLPTTVKTSDLPRECKLVFSVWLADKKQKKQKDASGDSLAWVNCLIFDYKNELRAGLVKLRMWPGVAVPSGTVQSNGDAQAVELSIQLRKEEMGVVRVFPTELLHLPTDPGKDSPTGSDKVKLDACINYHSLCTLTPEEKTLVRKYKLYCMQFPAGLPKYLQAVIKTDRAQVQESHRLMEKWAPVRSPVDALELLDARYPDIVVRSYAVRQLEKLTNAEVEDYLLQLVQVLKYESYHDSPLSRFLLKRAIRNKRIGHYLYWYLKSELHNPQLSERFGLLLEAFLKGGGNAREEITAQDKVHQAIVEIAYKVKGLKSGDPVTFLKGEVANLNKNWPPGCQLMLDPLFITKGIKVEKCKVMDSKMKPLWLLFENADPNGEDLNIIFKCGDDLRQDMLTLQLFRVMDKLWKKENLDLMLNPYGVIATGAETGLIEVVTSSNTISKIQKQEGGGASGAFSVECLAKWLKKYNQEDMMYKLAVENFTASCAGYCVATYVLGIGDRHNDNIMLKQDGHLFHIDFGHILGNFKKKYGFKRERVPFVFTPDWAFVMGGKGSEYYNQFVQDCMRSHNILRQNAQLFINLLSMMLISGMPELSCPEDIMYVVDTLNVSTEPKKKSSNDSMKGLLEANGSQFSTQFNFFVHNLVH